jgi:chromosome segregation ATPase
MSRVSDTRFRTREAAARIVASGRRPHDLTVDLIYAEIKQGSRTTINDELKLWKDEQAKVDALSAALPPSVANAMMAAWAVAVEHGEKVFEQRQAEIEGELAAALQRVQSLETDLAQAQEETAGLRAQLTSRQIEIEALRGEAAKMHTVADAAQARARALEQQLESARTEAENRMASVRTEYDQQLAELRATMTTQEQAFRVEIDKATERLEGVQKHVMLQVSEAREATRRAEALLAKSRQKNEDLSAEAQQLKTTLANQTQQTERAQADLTNMSQQAKQLQTERESQLQQLAMLTGKLDAQTAQLESLEHRACGAEARLEEALKRPATTKKKTAKEDQTDAD